MCVSASLSRHEHRTGSCGIPSPPRSLVPYHTTASYRAVSNGVREEEEEEEEEEEGGGGEPRKKNKNKKMKKNKIGTAC